jgi:hypothetical protein
MRCLRAAANPPRSPTAGVRSRAAAGPRPQPVPCVRGRVALVSRAHRRATLTGAASGPPGRRCPSGPRPPPAWTSSRSAKSARSANLSHCRLARAHGATHVHGAVRADNGTHAATRHCRRVFQTTVAPAARKSLPATQRTHSTAPRRTSGSVRSSSGVMNGTRPSLTTACERIVRFSGPARRGTAIRTHGDHAATVPEKDDQQPQGGNQRGSLVESVRGPIRASSREAG